MWKGFSPAEHPNLLKTIQTKPRMTTWEPTHHRPVSSSSHMTVGDLTGICLFLDEHGQLSSADTGLV